eukprot:GILK01013802.1.p1 GENE.GILK01013802.1~~GILK01013802.1.p1  ORF type:complete len:1013 (+),score=147.22 GILK01013802.1:35-3040(+)
METSADLEAFDLSKLDMKTLSESGEILHAAAETGRTDIVSEFLNKDIDVNLRRKSDGATPMHCACAPQGDPRYLRHSHVDVVRTLMRRGADPSLRGAGGPYLDKSPLQMGLTLTHAPNGTVDQAVSVALRQAFISEMFIAAANDDVDKVQRFLEGGFDVNLTDGSSQGPSALHWAASFGALRVASLLLSYSADINFLDLQGISPLIEAAKSGHTKIVQLLLQKGADVTVAVKNGRLEGKTAADLAANDEIRELIKTVSSANGCPSSSTASDYTPRPSPSSSPSSSSLPGATANGSSGVVDLHLRFPLLWPPPQKICSEGATIDFYRLPLEPLVVLETGPWVLDASAAWDRSNQAGTDSTMNLDFETTFCQQLHATLCEFGMTPSWLMRSCQSRRMDAAVTLSINGLLFSRPQSYKLRISLKGVSVIASDQAGLFYGVQTLCQLISHYHHRSSQAGCAMSIPTILIQDWPDICNRGVMLDISRDKVPTLETLLTLVETLAKWKYNQIQLYMEHTFQYKGHEVVHRSSSPLSGSDLVKLDKHCKRFFIDLVPNQNSLGHMHRWLKHPEYRDFAEQPEGAPHPFSVRADEPFSLCPTDDRSIHLMADLYDQLLPYFTSKLMNVGLDETEDIGHGRSALECNQKGKGVVYMEYLRKVYRLCQERGRTMMFWADILLQTPEAISLLPSDSIPLIWGYESDHDFETGARLFDDHGISFYVCPGTSSWQSFAGRAQNAVTNLVNAAVTGRRYGCFGYLVTDWGDQGHLQPLPVSYLGFFVGAACCWNVDFAESQLSRSNKMISLNEWVPHLLSVHAFKDEADLLGEIAVDLANVYSLIGSEVRNASSLFKLIVFHGSSPDLKPITVDGLRRAMAVVRRNLLKLQNVKLKGVDAALVKAEFQWMAELMLFSCRFGLAMMYMQERNNTQVSVSSLPPQQRSDFANKLINLLEEHRRLWSYRYRPGGFSDSALWLQHLYDLLLVDIKPSAVTWQLKTLTVDHSAPSNHLTV